MATPRLNSGAGQSPDIIRQRPAHIDTIYGKSQGGAPEHQQVNRQYTNLDVQDRYNPSANDTLIQRKREYRYRRPIYFGAANNWVNWTAAGPSRDLPTTRFNRNVRPIVGGGHRDMWGQHTNLDTGQAGGNQLSGKPRMMPGKQNNLTVQRYRGQSYSQTTRLAGQ